jgi:hypothetical protein
MRRLLPGILLFALACVLPGVGQTYVSLLGSDGNLYGASGNEFYSYSPTTSAMTVLNANASGLTLCLERSDGTLLGINSASTGYPELVKVTFSGQITALVQFPGKSDYPVCPALANDGDYYGTAEAGGDYDKGYFYQLTTANKLNAFYSFTGKSDGVAPYEPPIQASNGDLYDFNSALLRYSPTTGLAVYPVAYSLGGPLLEGPDGNFYTVGASSSVLQIQPTGATTSIYTVPEGGYFGDEPGGISNLYLSGNPSAPLDVLQGYSYSNYDQQDGCSAYGNYFQLVPLSLTGSAGNLLFSIGTDEENEGNSGYGYGYGNYYTYSLAYGGNGTFYGDYTDYGQSDDGEGDCNDSTYTYNVEYATGATSITMSLSKTHVLPKGTATLTWQVSNAFSDTLKQCFGFGGLSGAVALSGSATVTAPAAGSYVSSIVCGGTETGLATLTAGNATLALSTSATQVVIGAPVTLTAAVTNTGTPAPTGKVSFLTGSTVVGSANLVNGVATLTASTTGVPAGTYSVTSSYAGDANYGAAKSAAVAITVIGKKATKLLLTPASQTLMQGATAAFTATVTGSSPFGYGYPTGTVKFLLGPTVLGTQALSYSGSYMSDAALSLATTGFPAGTYSITASYSGDTYNLPSTSTSSVTITISPTTPVTVAASPNPVPAGDSFTLTATVKGKDNPGGTVIFYIGNTQELASTAVGSGGVAKVTLPSGTLPSGTYQLTAYYAGDANNPSGTSPAVTLTIE